jgi:plasmid stability protein
MPILHVRNVPDTMYERIQRLATTQRRSISAEVIALLDHALTDEERRADQLALLDSLQQTRFRYPSDRQVPDSVELLREDRQR